MKAKARITLCQSIQLCLAFILSCYVIGSPNPAITHEGEHHHKTAKPKASADIPQLPNDVLPFPTKIGGEFNLIDQHGKQRTLRDFAGKPVLIFFGYANCKSICSVALPRMVETIDLLKEKKIDVQPILITVDPENDTPGYMRKKLPKIHPGLVGLTGSQTALANARKAFHVESKHVSEDKDGGKVYSHGSYIYLMNDEGKFLTLMPPVLGPERMAEIVRGYLSPHS